MGCCICRIIWEELTEKPQGEKLAKVVQKHLKPPRFLDGHASATAQQQNYFVRAFLSEIHERRGLYRLDFRLIDFDAKRLATFLLEQTSEDAVNANDHG